MRAKRAFVLKLLPRPRKLRQFVVKLCLEEQGKAKKIVSNCSQDSRP